MKILKFLSFLLHCCELQPPARSIYNTRDFTIMVGGRGVIGFHLMTPVTQEQ